MAKDKDDEDNGGIEADGGGEGEGEGEGSAKKERGLSFLGGKKDNKGAGEAPDAKDEQEISESQPKKGWWFSGRRKSMESEVRSGSHLGGVSLTDSERGELGGHQEGGKPKEKKSMFSAWTGSSSNASPTKGGDAGVEEEEEEDKSAMQWASSMGKTSSKDSKGSKGSINQKNSKRSPNDQDGFGNGEQEGKRRLGEGNENAPFLVRIARQFRAVFGTDSSMQHTMNVNSDVSQMLSEKSIEKRIYNMRLIVMIVAILGLLFGIGVIEWCWRGYIPTPQEESGYCYGVATVVTNEKDCIFSGNTWIPAVASPLVSMKGVCETPSAVAIKALVTISTVILLGLLFYLYELHGKLLSIRRGDLMRIRAPKRFWQQGLGVEFLIEATVCFIHPPPGLSFDIFVEARGRTSVYNIESVLVSIMFLRCYLIWGYYREWLFGRYTTKNFASRMNDVPMDSKLAIKAILDDQPFSLIAFVVIISVVILAYLVRIAEAPVNVQHVYFWNQLWLIVVTLSATGYGDLYPITHLGRLVCCGAMGVGAFLLAVLTATVSKQLSLNAGESRLMLFLQSERWEKELRLSAIRAIQSWWRRSITHPKTLESLRTFRQKKRQYRKFLEATPHFGAFVSQMKEDNERVANSLSKMEQALAGGGGGFGPSPSLEGGWTRGGSGVGGGGVKGSFQGGGGGRRGGIEMQALSGKEFENLVMEIAQLKKTNEQLASIVEQHTAKQEAAALKVTGAAGALGGGHPFGGPITTGLGPLPGGLKRNDPVLVASEAVEERIKRLEGQITNLDQGMAKCLGQVVRLLQGLY